MMVKQKKMHKPDTVNKSRDAQNKHGDKKGSLDEGFMLKQPLSDELANTCGRLVWQNLRF